MVGEYQCGFRKGRSTTNQLFTMRHLLEKLWEYNITSYHLFIDIKTAYDIIDREKMWKALAELGIPDEIILMCKLVTENSQARVRINNSVSGLLQVKKGVKQGNSLAPVLFNLVLEAVIRRAKINGASTLINKSIQILGYADDLDIASRNLRAIKKAFESIVREAKRIGLIINGEKSQASDFQNSGFQNPSSPKEDWPGATSRRLQFRGDELIWAR